MKKLLLYVLIIAGAVYGVGFYQLSESGVARFLDNMHDATVAGNSKALCDMLADDMKVDITDHSVEVDRRLGDGKIKGGKSVLCAHFQATVIPMPPGITLQNSRDALKISRQAWLHPWTAIVTYTDKNTLKMQLGNRSGEIKTESDDKLQLEMTFTGVKITSLESEAWLGSEP